VTPPANDPPSEQLPLDPRGLDRYFAGEATPEERVLVERWLEGRPERVALLEMLRSAGSPGAPAPRMLDVDAMWRASRARVAVPAGEPVHTRRRVTRARAWPFVTGAVAAAVVVALLVISGRGRQFGVGGREYVTGVAERETITLPDGTALTLAPASRVRLAADYAQGRREVYLDGEAYFSVVHDARAPFAVHAGGVVARDIGTRFIVRSYRGEPTTDVVVAEGAVAIGAHVLTRAVRGSVDRQGVVLVSAGVDTTAYLGWLAGELAFDGAPMRLVAAELSRWYGVDVRVAPGSLGERLFSGRFSQKPLDVLLAQIAPVVGARVQRTGATITLYSVDQR
jgi:transmembrane sensor